MPEIIRVERHKGDYSVLHNNCFRNKNLSYKATGLLTTILSLPPEWKYSVKGMASIKKDGVASVRSALIELEASWYVKRERIRDTKGKFQSVIWVVYEYPEIQNPDYPREKNKSQNGIKRKVNPECDFPTLDNPTSDFPTSENQIQLNTKELNTKIINQSIKDEEQDEREIGDIETFVFRELLDEGKIPQYYVGNRRYMKIAINVLAEWDDVAEKLSKDPLMKAAYELCNEALLEMCCTEAPMKLRGLIVTREQIWEYLNKRIKKRDSMPTLTEIIDVAVENYIVATSKKEVKNHMHYMEACIWNILLIGDVAL